jgi:ABC-type nitrate/sulfonate/bicarbonate transport system substrate-binding protein
LVNRFAAAMRETAIWANQNRNHAASAQILVKYAKIDPSLVASMIRAQYGVHLTTAILQPEIDVTARYTNFTSFPARELMAVPGK